MDTRQISRLPPCQRFNMCNVIHQIIFKANAEYPQEDNALNTFKLRAIIPFTFKPIPQEIFLSEQHGHG